jgi:hypothetical protein
LESGFPETTFRETNMALNFFFMVGLLCDWQLVTSGYHQSHSVWYYLFLSFSWNCSFLAGLASSIYRSQSWRHGRPFLCSCPCLWHGLQWGWGT